MQEVGAVQAGQRVHFIGIGGYSMSGLAQVLLRAGVRVSGSDARASDRTAQAAAAGAEVNIGHSAQYIDGADVVVYSTDVPEHNPELMAARTRGLRVIHRSELLAELLNRQAGVAVTGTHGKTTTTAMVALLLERGGLDPTVLVGGEVDSFGGTAKVGSGPHLVAEADESDRSFLRYFPSIAVVTNMEAEHLEHYGGSFANIVASFRQFLGQVRPDGLAVVCADDPGLLELGQALQKRPGSALVVFYGLTSPAATWTATDVEPREGGIRFTVVHDGRPLGSVDLPVPGRHNVSNALGALAVGAHLGVPFATMAAALKGFGNARRRFQRIAEVGGVLVVDDYAHHPTEIRATLAAAKDNTGRRVLAVFQPQRYTRTAALMEEFAGAFGDADLLVLTEIYSPPGQEPIPGVSSTVLAEKIKANTGREVHLISDFEAIVRFLLGAVRPGDLVLTMGAGDIYRVAFEIARRLQAGAVQAG